jgi:hypothetical protein
LIAANNRLLDPAAAMPNETWKQSIFQGHRYLSDGLTETLGFRAQEIFLHSIEADQRPALTYR